MVTEGRGSEPRRSPDGRIARGERTRDAIVAAHTTLLREGVLRPTGKIIAARAGISLRTLWLNFKDLEALLEATTASWLEADAELRRTVPPDLPLEERIERFGDQRAVRLEHLAPAARSAALGEPFSHALQRSRRAHVARSISELAVTFAPELEAAGTSRETVANALYAATSWPTWATLRDDLGLDVDAARDVVRTLVTSILRT